MSETIPFFVPDSTAPELSDIKAEQALLGTILHNTDRITKLPAGFMPEHLASPAHQEIMRAMLALSASGTPSISTIIQYLRGSGIGADYLAALLRSMIAPNLLSSHVATVVDLWRRREMLRIADEMAASARSGNRDSDATVASAIAMSELDALSISAVQQQTMYGIDEAVQAAVDAGQRAASGVVTGIATGFRGLDEVLGALEPGALYVMAGRPGMGKTALAVQVALNMAMSGRRVLYDSLEMQAAQIGRRALAFMSGIPLHTLKHGRWGKNDANSIVEAQRRLSGVPLAIDQQSGISTAMIALKARTAKRKFGGLDAIFVDHMHIVATDSQAERNGAARAVEKVSNDLKKLAGDMGVPVIALAQLSRGTEGREDKRPEMSDLRQSGAIEQDAEAIMLLYRGEYYLKSEPQRSGTQSITAHEKAVSEWRDAKDRLAGIAEIIIPKNRDGSPGSVQMRFDGARTAFEDAQ